MSRPSTVFDLPDRLAAKRDPGLIAEDEEFFAVLDRALHEARAEVAERLAAEQRSPGGAGRAALDRDQQIHRLTAQLSTLRRFGRDLCLGRMTRADGTSVRLGRAGLTDPTGRRLLIDWRAPAAEPFFGATLGDPMGLVSRRRYRWRDERIVDYWDENLLPGGENTAATDDTSSFLAGLDEARTGRMRDVLGTIQADQDAVIRAGAQGALVVDGGPGTGKTVVALHRSAYLLYREPRLGHRRGGVLFIGPSGPYLDYVADVLPGLGEDGVRLCTLAELVPESASAVPESDPAVAGLKSGTLLVDAVDAAVRFHEQPPTVPTPVVTDWDELTVSPDEWAQAFGAVEPGTPHNLARGAILDDLVGRLAQRHNDDAPAETVEAALRSSRTLRRTLADSWPLVDARDLLGDLWTVPAYLRLAAPSLTRDEISRLQRPDGTAWTTADLPLLDAARARLGDPHAEAEAVRRARALATERRRVSAAVDDLLATGAAAEDLGSGGELLMLREADLQDALVDDEVLPTSTTDPLAGPFAHIVVDEAQELTDAQWRMVLRRCPSRSLTVVGDRAQAREGFPESWADRLNRVGLPDVRVATLRVNYRTPAEIMAVAEPVIRAVQPDAAVPVSVRHSGVPVRHASYAELDGVLADWLATHDDGTACVLGDPARPDTARVRSLSPARAKGLEFDLVVLVDPSSWGEGTTAAVDRYVAMTRATDRLVLLE